MGRLLIANSVYIFERLNTVYNNSGFVTAFNYSINNMKISTYYKMIAKQENVYTDGNRFVTYTGTLLYNGKIGMDASKEICKDIFIKKMSYKDIRDRCLGSFCLIICSEEGITLFVDETCTYRVYYHSDGEKYVITNTYYHVQSIFHLCPDKMRFLEFATRKSIMSNQSPIKGIKKLLSNEYIHINKDGRLLVCQLELNEQSYDFESLDEVIRTLETEIRRINDARLKNYRNILQFLTGGIDSRLELAILNKEGYNVKTAYWTGDDPITNGTKTDLVIASKLSKIQDREFTHFEVGQSYADACQYITNGLLSRFGEYAAIYSGNSKWFEIFNNLTEIDYVNFGYFGEVLRPLEELDTSYSDNYNLEKLISDVYCRSKVNTYLFKSEQLIASIVKEFEEICKRLGYDLTLSKTEAYNLFSFSRYEADCIVNNFINTYTFGFPLFSQKRISDMIFSIPYEMRKGEVIPLKLIGLFDERLLNVKFYSHHTNKWIDKNEMILWEKLSDRLKYIIKHLIKKTPLYGTLYAKYFRSKLHPTEANTNNIIAFVQDKVEALDVVKDMSLQLQNEKEWINLGGAAIGDFFSLLLLIDTMNHERKE